MRSSKRKARRHLIRERERQIDRERKEGMDRMDVLRTDYKVWKKLYLPRLHCWIQSDVEANKNDNKRRERRMRSFYQTKNNQSYKTASESALQKASTLLDQISRG